MSSTVSLPPYSMLATTPLYESNGVVVPGLMRPVVLPDYSDSVYTVTLAGERRLDLISELHYGTPDLWWVIASVNGLVDALAGVRVGTELRIPLKSRLAQTGILTV